MTAPGGLTELGTAAGGWEKRVAAVIGEIGMPSVIADASPTNARELRMPDWPAVPSRIRACLGRDRADRLCEARQTGRPVFQEEYAEWRLVRDEHGPVRFELTTEFSDYWELLARHVPGVALEEIGKFARAEVPVESVFGNHDPFGANSTEDARAVAFMATMLGRDLKGETIGEPGPLNDGSQAITCLSRRDNTLGALIRLAAAAAGRPQLVVDRTSGEVRFPSGSEAIPELPEGAAQDCRNSDPIVTERVVRLATEGRPIRLDDPVGVYIVDVQESELLGPDDEPLPRDWLKRSRQGAPLPDGLPRHQRLDLEIPEEAGFKLADVRSARTGRSIKHGAQIAELVQIGVYLQVGERDAVQVEVSRRPAPEVDSCSERRDCEGERELAGKLEPQIPWASP